MFIDAFDNIQDMILGTNFCDRGMGLGSVMSQIGGICSLDFVDHFIKECLPNGEGRKYGRYMDDSYLILSDYDRLVEIRSLVMKLYKKAGYPLNEKKCRIYPIEKSFVWLKKRYRLTESGRVVCKVSIEAFKRERKRLKERKNWVTTGRYTWFKYDNSFRSWICGIKKYYDSTASMNAMRDLFFYEFYCLLEEKNVDFFLKLENMFCLSHDHHSVCLVRVGVYYIALDNSAIVLFNVTHRRIRHLKNGRKIFHIEENKIMNTLKSLADQKVSYHVFKPKPDDSFKRSFYKIFDNNQYLTYINN